MLFSDLHLNPNILKAIEKCGYKEATPIQQSSIPVVLNGQDIVACAQTGTGKTAAFVLPALHRLQKAKEASAEQKAPQETVEESPETQRSHAKHNKKRGQNKPGRKPRILILTPTRELAGQVSDESQKYGKFLSFSITNIVGGMPYGPQIQKLQRGSDIIVATPGRLMDHMREKRVDLSQLEMLILDEADRMLDMGFIEDIETIAAQTPKQRQTLLFSATMDKQLNNIVKELLNEPTFVDLSQQKLTAPKIEQVFLKTKHIQDKLTQVQDIITKEQVYKCIIFTATKRQADLLAIELDDNGIRADALHGDLKQQKRNRIVEKLKRGNIQVLVATDVAARGIDISDITHVINFDLPRSAEDYVHRIGRTGRAGKSGKAFSFVSSQDMRHLQAIERYAGIESGITPSKSDQPRKSKGKKSFKSGRGFGDKGSRSNDRGRFSERSSRSGDRDRFGEKDSRSGDRDRFGDKKRTSDRDRFGDKKHSSDRDRFGEKTGRASDKDRFSDKKSRYGDKGRSEEKGRSNDKKSFGDKGRYGDKNRSSVNGRPDETGRSGERIRYADKKSRNEDGNSKKSYKNSRFNQDSARGKPAKRRPAKRKAS